MATALTHFYSGQNRIADRLPDLQERIDRLDPDARAEFERELDCTPAEVYAYQTAKSRAFAQGRISQDEALTIYNALGRESGGGWAEGTSLALKVAVTMAVSELVAR